MKKNSLAILLSLLFFLLLLFPEIAKTGAQDGLFLWYTSVVPILFPFIILSNIMVITNSFSFLLQPFFILKKLIPGLNPWYFYALLLGFFCGYPMGAKAINDLMEANRISYKEGTLLLPIVNQASPMFLAGYLGIHIFQRSIPLWKILSIIYIPPALCFFIILLLSIRNKQRVSSSDNLRPIYNQKNSMSQSMEHTIWNSFYIIVIIGIYMMIFTILMQLSEVLLPKSVLLSVGSCFLEFSSGLHRLNQYNFISEPIKNSLIFALTSFGGFCTAAQTISITKNTGISPKSYIFRKALLAILVFLLSYASSS